MLRVSATPHQSYLDVLSNNRLFNAFCSQLPHIALAATAALPIAHKTTRCCANSLRMMSLGLIESPIAWPTRKIDFPKKQLHFLNKSAMGKCLKTCLEASVIGSRWRPYT
jgi:hypothetical protein